MRRFRCLSCGHEWEEPYGTGKGTDLRCPSCGSTGVQRIDAAAGTGPRGQGRGNRSGMGRGSGQGAGRGMGRRRQENTKKNLFHFIILIRGGTVAFFSSEQITSGFSYGLPENWTEASALIGFITYQSGFCHHRPQGCICKP